MLNKDFKEFIEFLNSSEVRYLVVGGYAVALHGHPRYTKDLDIWVEASPTNAERLLKALDDFGLGSIGLQREDFLEADRVIQLGIPPERIDLLTSVSGVDFEKCHEAREQVEVDGVMVNFIDLENLRKNKKALRRPQDLADLDLLK